MKANIAKICLILSLGTGCQAIASQKPEPNLGISPVPTDLSSLNSRLDNLDSSVNKIQYVLDHLDKNIVMLQVIPLSEPHASFSEVAAFAVEGLTETLNFNSQNFRHQLAEAADFFSEPAYQTMRDFLSKQDLNDDAAKQVLSSSAVIMGPAVITHAGVTKTPHPTIPDLKRETYSWDVEIPLFMQTHENGQIKKTLTKSVKMQVVRCSVEYSADQMLIETIQFEDNPLGA